MSRPGNALGFRLGYSKNWKIYDNNFLKNKEDNSISLFINNWIKNDLLKKNFLIMDLNVVKQENAYRANILTHLNLRNDKQPFFNRYFWTVYSHINIYSYPTVIGFVKVKNVPVNPFWNSPKMKFLFRTWITKKYLQNRLARKASYYKVTTESLLEESFRRKFNKGLSLKDVFLKVRIYDVFDYFPKHCNNLLSNNLQRFFNTFLSDQRKIKTDLKKHIFYIFLGIILRNSSLIGNSIATVLSKGKEHGPMLYFFFKIIKEIFEVIPKDERRVSYIKIIIKGKIAGNERATKQIFSLGYLDKYDAVHKDISLNTKSNEIDYFMTESYTYTGALSIRVWTC